MTPARGPCLTQQQAVLLTMEVESAVNLLRDGREALRTLTHSSRGADTVWTLLSLGAEKVLKLSIGLAALEDTGEWPGAMLRGYVHRVVKLDDDVRELMTAGVGRAAQPAYVESALAMLNSDAVWPKIREGWNGTAAEVVTTTSIGSPASRRSIRRADTGTILRMKL